MLATKGRPWEFLENTSTNCATIVAASLRRPPSYWPASLATARTSGSTFSVAPQQSWTDQPCNQRLVGQTIASSPVRATATSTTGNAIAGDQSSRAPLVDEAASAPSV